MSTTTMHVCMWMAGMITLAGCPTTFLGSVCPDGDCALTRDGQNDARHDLTCSVYEHTQSVQIRDLPFDHPEIGLCVDDDVSSDAEGLVSCRMLWHYVGPRDSDPAATLPSCDDLDFLSPFPEAVQSTAAGDGPTCVVRQVTAEQAQVGKTGWYIRHAAAQHCRDAQPAAIVPSQRPDNDWAVEVTLQCGVIARLTSDADDGDMEQVPLQACAPPQPQGESERGKPCTPALDPPEKVVSLELGSPQCESGVCLSAPVAGDLVSGCSCRCDADHEASGPLCVCPATHECSEVLTRFWDAPEIRGSYCVPKAPLR